MHAAKELRSDTKTRNFPISEFLLCDAIFSPKSRCLARIALTNRMGKIKDPYVRNLNTFIVMYSYI